MKYMFASDIHGSACYCRKMLEAYESQGAVRLILLGDLLYHGPRNDLPAEYDPKQVLAMLNRYQDQIYAVRGNCDSEVDQMVLEFPILAEYCLAEHGGRALYATHGHHVSPGNPPLLPGDILLCGHTHIPAWENWGQDGLRLNPGSVSIPKEGSQHSYLVLEEGWAIWKTLEGEVFHRLAL